ncbi:hypothetical protein GTO89_00745 [Heliobacterium gestii]|uniref:Uncharacterized protein n=1 Tax=Heliomicrobium gestii TaxID=2699 RepID=A0A845L5T1_HELGE|nr:hypothetical protein [Heliomicrobium gestii]MBM7865297.1 hypothetical protein [Heliomicrobium gestii]MZP41558.1 hypothetical protein [Heliomicrobium gestii]
MAAAAVPAAIPHRPFAICPPTNMMNTDGFFVVNMGNQFIQANITNSSGAALQNVRVYIEGISDPGVTRVPRIEYVGDVPAGAAFSVRFLANFHGAAPGIAYVSFIVESDDFVFRRIIKKIFVTRVDYHKPSKTYSVVMPQGTMRIVFHSAMMGPQNVGGCEGGESFFVLPDDVTYEWIPTPPYAGVRGPLPYEDPWHKIALAILAGLIALGAVLYDYFSDGELNGGYVSVSGTFEETKPSVCCPKVETSAQATPDWFGKGLYSAAGTVATAAIASDGPDLHYRGQQATPPAPGELTVSESVRLKIDYTAPPSPGTKYPIAGKWEYTRLTTGNNYRYQAQDQRENLHYVQSYEVDAPAVFDRAKGPLIIRARFTKPDGSYFRGHELYVSAVLVSRHGLVRRFEMHDDGMGDDQRPNDAWYTGSYPIREDEPDTWYLFVLAQDVNTVEEGTDPYDAAQNIGGFLITPQLNLNFQKPCEINHDATIKVV